MQKYFNKKCIFCGKTEAEFDKHNCWTEEHIIPKALGNETLRIFNVCKKCNSGLGTYVDNYFVNNMFIKIIRQSLGLKGQSGEIPNAFKEGEDKNGHRIRVDSNYHPTRVPYIEQNDNKLRIVASSKDEARNILRKKLSRMNKTGEEIQTAINKLEKSESHFSKPEIQYNIEIDFNRFYMEILKIGFEYAIYKLGDDYLNDIRAKEIQNYLKEAINGKMKTKCKEFTGISSLYEDMQKLLRQVKLNCHMLMIHPDMNNNLIAEVILFMNPMLSFSIFLSDDATKFKNMDRNLMDVIQIKTDMDKEIC